MLENSDSEYVSNSERDTSSVITFSKYIYSCNLTNSGYYVVFVNSSVTLYFDLFSTNGNFQLLKVKT